MAFSAKAVLGTVGAIGNAVSKATSAGSSSSGAPAWLGLNPSGQLVQSSPRGSAAGSIQSAVDRIYQTTQENTARSEQQAAELRRWQEEQNKIAMDFSAAEAAKNRDWQEMMSNTAHQREIKDLQAAGLNPILSAMGGNGAAVGSGATASGVTSSGAKGEVDTSYSQGLVGLLGSLLAAQTQLESQRISAQTNLSIAEKNNSTSELVARLYTEQAREASQLAALTGIKQSEISAAASRAMASISAGATMYGWDTSRQVAEMQNETQKFLNANDIAQKDRATAAQLFSNILQTTANTMTTIRGQDVQAATAKDVAKLQSDTTKRGQNFGLAGDTIKGAFFGLGQYLGASSFGGRSVGFGRWK